jgi:hypothetical protein
MRAALGMAMGFRFQKRMSVLPGLRINLSKRGASASLGPRGADVNIGRDGITTNAGIPGTGLSYRSKVGGRGGWLGVALLMAGLAFVGFKQAEKMHLFAPAPANIAPAEPVNIPPAPISVIAVQTRIVNRDRSVIRDKPKTSGKVLKKESKGAAVTWLSEQDGWAKVTDGNITGYMRASVLGAP